MTGSSLGPVLLAGLGPVIFLFLIFLALFSGAGGWILWRPPVLWTDQFGPTRPYVDNTIIDITVESNSVETTGYLNGTIGGPGFNYSTEFGTPFIRDYSPNGRVLWTSMITDIPIGVCVYFLARRYSRRISKRPRSASPVRYRNTYRNPN